MRSGGPRRTRGKSGSGERTRLRTARSDAPRERSGGDCDGDDRDDANGERDVPREVAVAGLARGRARRRRRRPAGHRVDPAGRGRPDLVEGRRVERGRGTDVVLEPAVGTPRLYVAVCTRVVREHEVTRAGIEGAIDGRGRLDVTARISRAGPHL